MQHLILQYNIISQYYNSTILKSTAITFVTTTGATATCAIW